MSIGPASMDSKLPPTLTGTTSGSAPARPRRILVALSVLLGLTLVGTAGYVWIENTSVLDGLYMTVITLSTVGYEHVVPLSPAGKIFSIVLITTGLGSALYTVGAVAEFFIEGWLGGVLSHRSMTRSLAKLENHFVLVGYGRFGQVVASELARSAQALVVVDANRAHEAALRQQGLLYIIGSATEDSVLEAAGVKRARAVILATPSDSDNVFMTLSVREMAPEVRVHARAETETGKRRLRLAGAEQVICPHQLGGQRIANALLRPSVVDFVELFADTAERETDLQEVIVGPGSTLDGHSVASFRRKNLRVALVAVKRAGEPTRLSPSPRMVLQAGDRLVAVGDAEDLARVTDMVRAAG